MPLLGKVRLFALLQKGLDNIGRISVVLNTAPLLGRLSVTVVVEVVQRIVKRVGLGLAEDTNNLPISIALDTCLGYDGVLDGGDGEGIVGVCAGCGCAELLLCSTGRSLKTRYETETTIVLRKSLLLVPLRSQLCAFGCDLGIGRTSSSQWHRYLGG
jgi:hypothetical protein